MTKSSCEYYNWGGERGNPERPLYPREYGARCEFYKEFFVSDLQGQTPDCNKCSHGDDNG